MTLISIVAGISASVLYVTMAVVHVRSDSWTVHGSIEAHGYMVKSMESRHAYPLRADID